MYDVECLFFDEPLKIFNFFFNAWLFFYSKIKLYLRYSKSISYLQTFFKQNKISRDTLPLSVHCTVRALYLLRRWCLGKYKYSTIKVISIVRITGHWHVLFVFHTKIQLFQGKELQAAVPVPQIADLRGWGNIWAPAGGLLHLLPPLEGPAPVLLDQLEGPLLFQWTHLRTHSAHQLFQWTHFRGHWAVPGDPLLFKWTHLRGHSCFGGPIWEGQFC